jgi:hypothetical protein
MTVAGCAATRTTTGPVTSASRTAASPTARERAVAEAAAILKAFVVPPSGQRLPKAPDVLKTPSSTLVSTALVDDVSKHSTFPRKRFAHCFISSYLEYEILLTV